LQLEIVGGNDMEHRISGNRPANILIVDDTTSNLVILAEMIKSIGYIARPVTNVRQALAAISVEKPQLILLDISMPEIDGFDFCEIVKQDPFMKDVPIIFISALNSTEDKVKGFKLGAVDFISKPFELEEITLRVNTHLKIFQMQNELKIHNKQLFKMFNNQVKKVTDEQKQLIYVLSQMVDTREDMDGEHIKRVVEYCKLLAMSLQFIPKYEKQVTAVFLDSLQMAAPLHDIGKVFIRDDIILKNGPLSKEEMDIVKKHTTDGAKKIGEMSLYGDNETIKMAVEIAKYHHEKWDGTGYPEGLKGEEIPLSARILSVVDVYDILTSNRCYRDAYSHEEALEIMEEESGKSFDPEIIRVFMKLQKRFQKTEGGNGE
jgi:putative two-component system response regulator